MTEHLINALSRRSLARSARPAIALLLAVALAYGGAAWLAVLNGATGAQGPDGTSGIVIWARAATIAVPLMFAVAWVALLATRRLLERAMAPESKRLGNTLVVTLTALLGGVTLGVASPVVGWLLGVAGGSFDGGPLPLALRNTVLVMPAMVVLAGIVTAIVARGVPWAAAGAIRTGVRRTRQGRIAFQAGLVVVLLAPITLLAQGAAQRAIAQTGPGTPCPVGAPVKTFAINAINVDIPLNRFGDHDPSGKMYVLNSMEQDVRVQETSRHVSIGLRDDPIQPLVIRANIGDCVEIAFQNKTDFLSRPLGGVQVPAEVGVHIDGLEFQTGSSGDAVGQNPTTSVVPGGSIAYRYYIPNDPDLEGAHYLHPGPNNRRDVSHGLFGQLVVEPAGSRYYHPDTGLELPAGGWGWEATIAPAGGKSFREVNLIHHEIGDELYKIPTTSPDFAPQMPVKDPVTLSYRPGSRALNYRSEPFNHRLGVEAQHRMKAYSYNSYTFGDPATPMPRGYLGDPMKIRLTHGGSELFHVYHLHGGGDRWRVNPHADKSYKYSDTGLNKNPIPLSASQRLDSQSIGPGESYNLEIEGGSGGVQQSAGDFLFHCHIAEHYVSGMWSVWRVYDTRQPDFAPLPDRTPLPAPVDSTGLIGKTMPDGSVITAANLDKWVEPQLPPQGVQQKAVGDPISLDGAVWDWKRGTGGNANVYYGAPEDATGVFAGSPWLAAGRFPNLTGPDDQLSGTGRTPHAVPGHPGLLPIDGAFPVSADARPRLLFNPVNGRPAHPLLRTQIGQRPPYTANGHTGAPWTGERANKQPDQPGIPDPWAKRPDGLCPATSPDRHFNIVSVQKPIQVTRAGAYDQFGKIYVLAKNKDKVRNGSMPSEPLAIRANIGDCVTITATSEQTPDDPNQPFPMMNLHIHHVQFDPSGSDGATAGMAYGQAVRPYRLEDGQIVNAVTAGATSLTIKPTLDQPVLTKYRVGIFIGVGLGTEQLEVAKITAITNLPNNQITVTLDRPLKSAHAADEYAGTEYVQEIWYPDVVLDNIFWHDHVDGIHNWGHGLVGQLIIEPKGSTYHDPITGDQVDSGTQVDIHTNDPLAPGLVDGSFREFVLWTIDQNPGGGDATVNLRAEPFSDRKAKNPDPSLLFSSATHGDPFTPLPRAYAGDPFVIRTINVSSTVDTLRVDGHKYFAENRMLDGAGKLLSSPLSGIVYGVSERFSLIFKGGAGGERKQSGDFLYGNGLERRQVQGAWGLIRVLPRQVGDLQPLPGTNVPTGPTPANPTPDATARPGSAGDGGSPCPAGAPARSVNVAAIDVPGAVLGRTVAYVPAADADAAIAGIKPVEPLVIHAAAGECLTVHFTNRRSPNATDPSLPRASMHVAKLVRDVRSSGVNIGWNPEQTVSPGQSRDYNFYVDDEKLGTATISDTGGDDTGAQGLYGAVEVAPPGAVFTDPVSGVKVDFGTRVDVTVPGRPSYRDLTAFMGDNDPIIGTNTMPYPFAVAGPALFNYGSELGRPLGATQFSSNLNSDPHTVWSVYTGDAMRVHVVGTPGSEQTHVFNLGGHTWAWDPNIPHAEQLANQSFGPHTTIDAVVRGGAGAPGDYFVGNIRRPFTDAGQWGILRVLPAPSAGGPIRKLAPQSGSPAPDPLPIPQADQTPLQNPEPVVVAGPTQTQTKSTTTTVPVPRLLGPLRLPASITSRALARQGLAFSLTAPKSTRAARVKVFRVLGKRRIVVANQVLQMVRRQSKMTKAVQARIASLTRFGEIKVSSTGLVSGVWKPSAPVLNALRTGPYLVEVQTGDTTTTFLAERAKGTTRIRVVATTTTGRP